MPAISPLLARHGERAAQLHIAGQPGTFLTDLGPDVLTVLYRSLPQSNHGFGFAAIDGNDEIAGFVSATTSVGGLFVELGTRHLGQFLPPLSNRYIERPMLLFRSFQTLFYPFMVESEEPGETMPTAELLSIMVEPERRGQGIGSRLIDALIVSCLEREMKLLDVTVDADNSGARRFYESHAFSFHKSLTLNGREMCQYRRIVEEPARG